MSIVPVDTEDTSDNEDRISSIPVSAPRSEDAVSQPSSSSSVPDGVRTDDEDFDLDVMLAEQESSGGQHHDKRATVNTEEDSFWADLEEHMDSDAPAALVSTAMLSRKIPAQTATRALGGTTSTSVEPEDDIFWADLDEILADNSGNIPPVAPAKPLTLPLTMKHREEDDLWDILDEVQRDVGLGVEQAAKLTTDQQDNMPESSNKQDEEGGPATNDEDWEGMYAD